MISDASGAGLRIEGDLLFELTARRWTSEQVDASRHQGDIVPGEHVWVNIDRPSTASAATRAALASSTSTN